MDGLDSGHGGRTKDLNGNQVDGYDDGPSLFSLLKE